MGGGATVGGIFGLIAGGIAINLIGLQEQRFSQCQGGSPLDMQGVPLLWKGYFFELLPKTISPHPLPSCYVPAPRGPRLEALLVLHPLRLYVHSRQQKMILAFLKWTLLSSFRYCVLMLVIWCIPMFALILYFDYSGGDLEWDRIPYLILYSLVSGLAIAVSMWFTVVLPLKRRKARGSKLNWRHARRP
jgi:hypothetical protein